MMTAAILAETIPTTREISYPLPLLAGGMVLLVLAVIKGFRSVELPASLFRRAASPSLTLGNNVSLPGSLVSLAACHVSSTDLLVWTQMSQLSRQSFRPIASGQHPSAIAKHDQATRILLNTGSVD